MSRMRNTEKMLSGLPEAADGAFRDLQATPGLKNRILAVAEEKSTAAYRMKKMIPVLACALVLAVGGVLVPYGIRNGSEKVHQDHVETAQHLSAIAAGQLPEGTQLSGADMREGSITVKNGANAVKGQWENADSTVCLDGAYYRLTKQTLSGKLKGAEVGCVGQDCSSSVLLEGEKVYAVKGMENACVTAEMNGEWRLFQRVSFAGRGLQGSEGLKQTLLPSKVESFTLEGQGTVSGSAAERLREKLLDAALFGGNNTSERGKVLLIRFDNGITLQAIVSEDKLMACGTWICPDFEQLFSSMN